MAAYIMAKIYERELIAVSCHANTETADLLGSVRRSSEHKTKLDQFLEEAKSVAMKRGGTEIERFSLHEVKMLIVELNEESSAEWREIG